MLVSFARGRSVGDIANEHHLSAEYVREALTRLARMDRQEAGRVLRDRDSPTRPAGAPVASWEDLLAAGESHAQARIQALAGKARALLTTLRTVLDEEQRTAAAKARVAELEQQLAQARAEAGVSRPLTVAKNPDAKAARAWAAKKGVPCPPRGRVPQEVMDAYHQDQAAAPP